MAEKRLMHICACGSSRTRSGFEWICDRAGRKCPGHGLPLNKNLSAEQMEKIQKERKVAPARPAVVATTPIVERPSNYFERNWPSPSA